MEKESHPPCTFLSEDFIYFPFHWGLWIFNLHTRPCPIWLPGTNASPLQYINEVHCSNHTGLRLHNTLCTNCSLCLIFLSTPQICSLPSNRTGKPRIHCSSWHHLMALLLLLFTWRVTWPLQSVQRVPACWGSLNGAQAIFLFLPRDCSSHPWGFVYCKLLAVWDLQVWFRLPIFLCMYVCAYTCAQCPHAYVYVHVCLQTHICTACMHVYMHVYIRRHLGY